MSIETVFFDVGNTLCTLDMTVMSDVLSELGHGVPPADLETAEPRARLRVDVPEATTDSRRRSDYLESMLREARVPEDLLAPAIRRLKSYHRQHNLWSRLPADVPPLLSRLRSSGYRLGVVSNSNGTVRRKLERLAISCHFEVIVDSHEEGVEKPDPRLFRIALERTKARPETTAYVGDLYHVDAVGAREAGLFPILLDPAGLHADKPVCRISSLLDLESVLRPSECGVGKPR